MKQLERGDPIDWKRVVAISRGAFHQSEQYHNAVLFFDAGAVFEVEGLSVRDADRAWARARGIETKS